MEPDFDTGGKIRYQQHRYAEDAGWVEQTIGFYISDPSKRYLVRRLLRQGSN
jgi:hypothetical protein